jgi:hypothetical protein
MSLVESLLVTEQVESVVLPSNLAERTRVYPFSGKDK